MQQPAARHPKLVALIGGFDDQRGIAERRAPQASLDLARGDELTVAPGEGAVVDREDHRERRFVDRDGRQVEVVFGMAEPVADVDALEPGDRGDVARVHFFGGNARETLERIERAHRRGFRAAVRRPVLQPVAHAHGAGAHPTDPDPADELVIVERYRLEERRSRGVVRRRGHMFENRVEQRIEVRAEVGGVERGRAGTSRSIHHGEIELLLVGVQLDEEVEHLVQHTVGARVRAIHLVDDDDRAESSIENAFWVSTNRVCGIGPSNASTKSRTAVDHAQERPLHFAAKVGVARACPPN